MCKTKTKSGGHILCSRAANILMKHDLNDTPGKDAPLYDAKLSTLITDEEGFV